MKKGEYTPKRDYKSRYDLIRYPDRIRSSDVIEGVFDNISYFDSPDPTLIAARGTLDGIECMILGQEKRRKGKESEATGMITARGHSYVLDKLEVEEGGTTEDGFFTIERVACLGCCGMAPAVMIDDDFYGRCTIQNIEETWDKYRSENAGS